MEVMGGKNAVHGTQYRIRAEISLTASPGIKLRLEEWWIGRGGIKIFVLFKNISCCDGYEL